ncbi:YflJ family protein [Bacillus sp. REN10]|uniref:YflJ family protein n=1 Tax=Bacillus sp. REN10 TaxID=2782541 RepID=UPI00193BF498|nr:YflJ family protein [Bacillus sp. REN10]
MAHLYSKGWFIQQLKQANITKLEGRKLETYKTHVVRNLYLQLVEQKELKIK